MVSMRKGIVESNLGLITGIWVALMYSFVSFFRVGYSNFALVNLGIPLLIGMFLGIITDRIIKTKLYKVFIVSILTPILYNWYAISASAESGIILKIPFLENILVGGFLGVLLYGLLIWSNLVEGE